MIRRPQYAVFCYRCEIDSPDPHTKPLFWWEGMLPLSGKPGVSQRAFLCVGCRDLLADWLIETH